MRNEFNSHNVAAVSLFWNTNMAAVTSYENTINWTFKSVEKSTNPLEGKASWVSVGLLVSTPISSPKFTSACSSSSEGMYNLTIGTSDTSTT